MFALRAQHPQRFLGKKVLNNYNDRWISIIIYLFCAEIGRNIVFFFHEVFCNKGYKGVLNGS